MKPQQALDAKLKRRFKSGVFQQQLAERAGAPTPTPTPLQAALAEMVKALAPADVLEIGAYFGETTRLLAKTVDETGGGSVVAIDPFGGERVPGIVAGWPEGPRAATRFHAQTSMEFFAALEAGKAGRGAEAPFNLVFVDGNHAFEYVYFDLISAALNLRPGGAIVIAAIDQAGPARALQEFRRQFSHWRLLSTVADLAPEFLPGTNAAVLIAPPGVEVTRVPYKISLYNLEAPSLSGLRIPLSPTRVWGEFHLGANLYSLPADHHLTGAGLVNATRRVLQVLTEPHEALEVAFDPPVVLEGRQPGAPIHLEIELWFDAVHGSNLLIDAQQPITPLP